VIRVVLADDHSVVRLGLASLLGLAGDIDLVGQAEDGPAAVALVQKLRPDVLLLDVRMPRGDGLWVIDQLQALGLALPILLLTTFDDDKVALEAIRRGVRGYLLKNVTLERLLAAVRALAAGATFLSPGLTESAARALAAGVGVAAREADGAEDDGPERDPEISPREREVLRLLAAGFSNREIGSALHVAEGTIKNHVSNILGKMGVRDRTRAVLKAAERGFL
jgi:DNA-binding NarL/FixJ family response regulator